MKCEQFIYGLFKDHGIQLLKSNGLNGLLNGDIIKYLCQLPDRKDTYSNLWPNGVITISKVHSVQDQYGRSGVWNHTIAIRLMDYLAYMQPSKALHSHFIHNLNSPPEKLEPITIGEKI